MSKQNWQLQLRKGEHVGAVSQDTTYHWLDIVSTDSGRYGPGTKSEAKAFLHRIRATNPGLVYRIVKVSPL